jgi:hypothetical protein
MRTKGLLFFLLTLLATYQAYGQCRIINNKYASVYITFERVGTVTIDGETRPGVVLRLTNNSNCAITMQTQDFDPRKQAIIQDLPYTYRKGRELEREPAEHVFAVMTIRGGKSILFSVLRDHFDDEADEAKGWIEVPFGYKWEEDSLKDGSTVSTNHKVVFAISWTPRNVTALIKNKR